MTLQINRNNLNRAIDRTDVLAQVPYVADITEALGIFDEHYSTQKNIEIVRSKSQTHLLEDRNWDERAQNMSGKDRDFLQLKIPHIPADDAIFPHDIDGVLSFESPMELVNLASVAEVRAEKMVALQNAHQLTKTAARFQLLNDGTVRAPHGTMRTSYGDTVNFYTEFGVTRDSIALSFSGTNDPRGQVRDLVAQMRVAIRGIPGSLRGFVVLCGSEFFTALLMNPFATDAYKASTQVNQSLSALLGVPADDARFSAIDGTYPSLNLWGVTWVDVGASGYDSPTGYVPFVADDKAMILPVGMKLGKTYYAPANLFSSVNKKSQGSYWFETATDRSIKIETEQNYLTALIQPQAIKTLTLA